MNTLLLSFATNMTWLNVILLIAGVVIVLKGADWLTDGAVGIAEKMGIPQLVIGLTIVAMGTSMPELCVSLVSALKNTPDLAVGNVVGSNTFNTLLIVGCAAMVAPITVLHSTVKKDIPFTFIASMFLFIMCVDGKISRLDAAILLIFFILFMVLTLRTGKQTPSDVELSGKKPIATGKAILLLIIGMAGLVLGSNVFVDNASFVAAQLGVSDAIIGLTIVAGGTSMPELATSIVSARKGDSGIAIGNVLGSNVFNILMILGVTGVISPMTIQGITTLDLSMLIISMTMFWLFSFTKYRVERWEGLVLSLTYIGYLSYLIINL